MGIPSSSYFDQNKYGKPLPVGWNTLKVMATKVKDLVSYKDQQSYPCLILDLEDIDGIQHALFLKTDDSSNFEWANISRLFELEWQDGVEIESIQALFEKNVVGETFDAFITHSKPGANGKIYVNIKEYAPAGTGGGDEEEAVTAPAPVAEPAPTNGATKKRKF